MLLMHGETIKILALTSGLMFCVNLSNLEQIDVNIKCLFGLLCGAVLSLANYPEFKDKKLVRKEGKSLL